MIAIIHYLRVGAQVSSAKSYWPFPNYADLLFSVQ